MNDSWILLFLILLGGWVYRTDRALKTLRLMPVISKPSLNSNNSEDFVSILVPAKNEETNIEACVETLLAQDYAHCEIIVINDNSTDKTESILRRFVQNPRFSYVNAPATPTGWTGKNFALHSGIEKARGSWVLFTDADTRHDPSSVRSSLQHAQSRGLKFLSLLPHCLTGGFLEDLIQPCAMIHLGLWFPIEKINDPKSGVYFANGQYLLMEKQLYQALGGHAEVKQEFLEDFALMKKSKISGAKTECALGAPIYGTRMYDSLAAIWRGWRRIYLHAFTRNGFVLSMKALETFLFSALPFFCFFAAPNLLDRFLMLVIVTIMIITAAKGYGIIKAKRIYALLQPFAALVITGILMDAAGMAFTKRQTKWR